jgi:cob(I)alamin adenosyltransferase
MSIVTKTGDAGTTGLMYNRRVSKGDPRVEAYGTVDELNAALGVARACVRREVVNSHIEVVQGDLIGLMGELATHPDDLERYVRDGYLRLDSGAATRIEEWAKEAETEQAIPRGWATPGKSPEAAALDLARAVCRRAERRVCTLLEAGQADCGPMLVYLNRLSDLLWLHARQVEGGSLSRERAGAALGSRRSA